MLDFTLMIHIAKLPFISNQSGLLTATDIFLALYYPFFYTKYSLYLQSLLPLASLSGQPQTS